MTVEEFNEFFKTLEPTIARVGESSIIHFENVDALGEYLKRETDFWRQYTNGEVANIQNRYGQVYNAFVDLANQIATKQAESAKANLKSILDELKSAPIQLVQSDSVLGRLIVSEYAINWQVAGGMYSYFAKRIDRNLLSNFDMFHGVLKAHWFSEGATAAAATANSRLAMFENQAKSYDETFRTIFAQGKEQLRRQNDQFGQEITQFAGTRDEKFSAFDQAFNAQKVQFDTLSRTYEEYLRLKGPARYWNELAKEYEAKGSTWRCWAMAISAVFVAGLCLMLYNPPALYDLTQEFWSGKNIKGTILSAIIVSIFAYVIQFTVKLALSSFHLARDAKERAQLTYFYLSMVKKGALQDTERAVVMQSLFSRSDTGLLKNDAGPTMPTSVLENIKPKPPAGH